MNKKFLTKLVVIGALILALMVPLTMIQDVVSDRGAFRDSAKYSIAESWTGQQKFLGPVLMLPYSETFKRKVWDKKLKDYREETYAKSQQLLMLPEELTISADIATEERNRGLYAIPVYDAALAVQGRFRNQKALELSKRSNVNIIWNEASVSLIVSDIRGIVTQPVLNWNDSKHEFVSGSGLKQHGNGMRVKVPNFKSTQAADYRFSFQVQLHGMETLEFSPVGKSTLVDVRSDWMHPSFVGRYLPGEREINKQGFSAQWRVSSFSSDMERAAQFCQAGECGNFINNTFGISLFQSVDVYQQTERSVKYAVLFITLTFVAFFLFEIIKSLRLHPMHYLLVGSSLTVFYLLLISLSEHIAFSGSYLIASLADAAVIGVYISAVLKSRVRAGAFTGVLLLLYGMLYVILRSEDNALLMGSVLIFAVLTLVMIITRKLDWYKVAEQMANQEVIIGGKPNNNPQSTPAKGEGA